MTKKTPDDPRILEFAKLGDILPKLPPAKKNYLAVKPGGAIALRLIDAADNADPFAWA